MATHGQQINGLKKIKTHSGIKSSFNCRRCLLTNGHLSSKGSRNMKAVLNIDSDLETDSVTCNDFRELKSDTNASRDGYRDWETPNETRNICKNSDGDSGISVDFSDLDAETSLCYTSREMEPLWIEAIETSFENNEMGRNNSALLKHGGHVKENSKDDNSTIKPTVVYSIIPRDTPGIKNINWEPNHLKSNANLGGSEAFLKNVEISESLNVDDNNYALYGGTATLLEDREIKEPLRITDDNVILCELTDEHTDGDLTSEPGNEDSVKETSNGTKDCNTVTGNSFDDIDDCTSILQYVYDICIEVDDQSSEPVLCDLLHPRRQERCHHEERHPEYLPVTSLTLNKLPVDIRDESFFVLLQLLCALTVKISVRTISGKRPVSQGTGWLFDKLPEVDTIEKSLKGIVYIATSSHLVPDNMEARSCIVEFSAEASKYLRKTHLQCESVQHISSSGEVKTYLKCTTEDLDFVYRLNMIQEHIKHLSDSLPLAVKDRLTNMAIVLCYPHGEELAMSYGSSSIIRRKLVKEIIEDRERYQLKNIITCATDKEYDTVQLLFFTAVTCPGSIGAPIITFKQCGKGSKAEYSLNIWTHCGVIESLEFSCSLTKAYTSENLATFVEQRSITSAQTQEKKKLDAQKSNLTEAPKNQQQDSQRTQEQVGPITRQHSAQSPQPTKQQHTQPTQQQYTQSPQQQYTQSPQQQYTQSPQQQYTQSPQQQYTQSPQQQYTQSPQQQYTQSPQQQYTQSPQQQYTQSPQQQFTQPPKQQYTQSPQQQYTQSPQQQFTQSPQQQYTQSPQQQYTQSPQQVGNQTSQQQLNHEPRTEVLQQQGILLSQQETTPGSFSPIPNDTQNENIKIVSEAPSYPAYLTYNKRLETFSTWPATSIHKPNDLAKNGFFYAGYSDCVRCYQCGVGLKSWKPGDDLVIEHRRFRPKCAFLRLLTSGSQTSLNAHAGNQDVSSLIEAGGQSTQPDGLKSPSSAKLSTIFPANIPSNTELTVHTALVSYTGIGPNAVSGTSSHADDSTFKTEEHQTEVPTASTSEVRTTDLDTSQNSTLNEGQAHETHDLAVRLLQQENEKLQELMKCKVCRLNPIKSLFLPCGDLYSCEECAINLTSCPQCGKRILGTVTTFFT